ncbi:putative ADP-ribosylation factor GTPase-activating protein AGD13 [Apostasia shenzhenica]|uniref:Putative ADP-ribosylation factor GTPase-activating protein AGD13 n=1 Tax=Apostasia shenzhenica TaxID=1088818 RepID=A0A2H9ZTK9_9ASPA|nr:putative ADP-ribosylation factor GTPase-activating protein AGD13 [Apostasia shenzhenica]
MDRVLGLLRLRVLRGVNLAIRDFYSSDPYVIVRMGKQKLKTRVIKKNVNPEWNEELTLIVEDPALPVKLEVYDRDRFSFDDPMGEAEFDIQPYFEAVQMDFKGLPDGIIIRKLLPNRQNCFAEGSDIRWVNGKVSQEMILRLKNVECGEIQLQLHWISIPSSTSFEVSVSSSKQQVDPVL